MKFLDQSAQTNWKFIAIIAFVAVFLAGGILMLIPQFQEQPSPLPQPNNSKLDTSDFTLSEVEGWQTYRSEEFGFEVRYPGGWRTIEFEDLTVFNDEQGKSFMTLTFANRAIIGISFCGAYPQDKRCETLKGNNIDFVIDWQPNGEPVAETDLNADVTVFITLHQFQEKTTFKQILSTFRFVKDK